MMGVIKSKKTWVVSAAALFVFTMAFDFYVHGRLLTDLYAQTSKLWRSDAEMKSMSMYCVLFHASIAVLIAMFYACWRENQTFGKVGSAKCPYRKSIMGFGLWIGLFMGALAAAAYIWMPISAELARMWFLAALVKGLLMGIVLNFVHTRYEAA
jgi:hypothetical protein